MFAVAASWAVGGYACSVWRTEGLRHRVSDLYREASLARNKLDRGVAPVVRDGVCVAPAESDDGFCGQAKSRGRRGRLVATRDDWSGRFLGPDGELYLGGFAYSKETDSFVGVYASRDAASAELIWRTLPWGVGLGAATLIVLPLGLGLLYRSSTRSHEEAAKLEQELLRFRAGLEQAREAIVILSAESGRILDVNQTACELLNHSKDELTTMSPGELKERFLFGAPESWKNYLERAGSDDDPVTLAETLHLELDQLDVPVEASVRRLQVGDQALIVAVVRDVSQRRRAEKKAALSQMRYQAVVQTAGSAIICISPTGRIFEWNREAERIFGKPRMEALGQNYFDLCLPDAEREESRQAFERVLAGESSRDFENVIRREDGQERVLIWNADRLPDPYGGTIGAIAVGRDITARKRAEQEGARVKERLQQAQKLEAIGLLAGGVAHDFNNLLTSIIGFAELTAEDLPPGTARNNLGEVILAGERAQGLVRQLLLFSRQAAERPRPVKVAEIVKEVLRLLQPSTPENVSVATRVSARGSLVQADPTQIHQVVMNLCRNAIQAMGRAGGELLVELSGVRVDASSRPGLVPGAYLRLAVSDTGPGVQPAIRDRIFEPFFTTKDVGDGAGLGLSVVHGVVQSLGGEVSLEAADGRGARFVVLLPRLEPVIVDVAAELPRGVGRVLLVDDEPSITRLGSAVLEQLGYDVSVCASSVGAANLFRQNPEKYDLVIADLTMPKMNGLELAREVRSRRDVPVLLATGFAERVGAAEIEEAGVEAVIRKPFDRRELGRRVHEALGERAIARGA